MGLYVSGRPNSGYVLNWWKLGANNTVLLSRDGSNYSNAGTYTYDKSTGTVTLNITSGYVYANTNWSGNTITVNRVGHPKDFIVGNKEEQYPNNDWKNGLYYELIGQITSTNALSLSNSAYDLTRDIAVEEIRNEVILNGTNS